MTALHSSSPAREVRRAALPPPPPEKVLPTMQSVLRTYLEPLLGLLYNAEGVTEIALNGPGDLWCKMAGSGWYPLDAAGLGLDLEWARRTCSIMANLSERRFDPDRWPLLAAPLPGGHRLQAVLGGATRSGLVLAIRVRRRKQFTFVDFGLKDTDVRPADPHRTAGAFDSGHAVGSLADLRAVAAAGLPILISGSTDSGKTSFTSTMLSELVPETRRVLTVEDVEEIDLGSFPNSIGLIAEPATSGSEIGYTEMMRAALRLNPDVVLQGEIQVDGAMPAYRLLNTGHEGFMATLHADSPLDALEAWRTMLAIAVGASAASEALGVIARKVARIVQLGPGKKVLEIGRPIDLDWRRLLRG